MKKSIPLLIVMSVGFVSCNQGSHVHQGDAVSKGDVEIRIDIENDLADEIQVVSAVSKRPGSTNPIETLVELKNVGSTEARILCVGNWHDARNNYCGGTSSVVVLPPHQTHKMETGTRTKRVTAFNLAVTSTELTQDEVLTSLLNSGGAPKAEGYGITYTETPTSEKIPVWTPRGQANGEPFQAKTIMFSPGQSTWKLQIIDRQVDPLKGLAIARYDHPDLQVINVNLPSQPHAGASYEREMSFGGGYFQIKTSPDSNETTSWNTDMAWVIHITQWNQKPWLEGGGTFQQTGTASGRLYIAVKGSEYGMKNSWVSGTFENAAIVYYGKPR